MIVSYYILKICFLKNGRKFEICVTRAFSNILSLKYMVVPYICFKNHGEKKRTVLLENFHHRPLFFCIFNFKIQNIQVNI